MESMTLFQRKKSNPIVVSADVSEDETKVEHTTGERIGLHRLARRSKEKGSVDASRRPIINDVD